MEQPELNTTNIMNNNTEDFNNNSTSAIPEYVCCVITEAIWTWFATILFSVILLLLATLKYCRKYLSKPKFDAKNLMSGTCTKKFSKCNLNLSSYSKKCT